MSESGQGNVNQKCHDCEIVVYDVSYSGKHGSGYLNAEFCPMCGLKLGYANV